MITELSILIPVFNNDVRPLVTELHAQCRQQAVKYEILLFDDASEERIRAINRQLAELPHVIYQELPQNIGRAAIRNKLATAAAYEYLLMLDNDCLPSRKDFVSYYLHEAAGEAVVAGGVAYQQEAPDRIYRLHWKYGQRAAKTVDERRKEPYKNIFLSNVLVKKALFLQYQLCESLKDYGHEDTLFALQLERQGVQVKHIENPAVHLGLEPTDVFLAKTEQAVANLVKLYVRGEQLDTLKLVKAYKLLQEKGLEKSFLSAYRGMRKIIRKNLYATRPSMFFFDLYRLFLFTRKLQNDTQL
ncbi:glycosyltransferase [Botryobacter ruber]|uniref:glycosyltransferase n=1 Tax=Botryobacter ruber TaxID=2171629 RepID=UPI000E0B1811|nr:glycosyltransferase [Botryobacter ruber]